MQSTYLIWFGLCSMVSCIGCTEESISSRIAGTWYVQSVAEGPVATNLGQFKLVFDHEAQTVTFHVDEQGFTEVYSYQIDEDSNTIALQSTDRDLTHRYELSDDLLSLYSITEETKRFRSSAMELTRTPEGLPQHEVLRERGPSPFMISGQLKSNTNLREIHKAALDWAGANKSGPNRMPASIGVLVAEGGLLPEYALAPWAEDTLPTDFSLKPKAEQIKWIDRHTSYGYVVGGQAYTLDPKKLVLFELLPTPMKLDELAVCYDNTVVARLPLDKAKQVVLDQTGYSLEQWGDATYPGTGQISFEPGDKELAPEAN